MAFKFLTFKFFYAGLKSFLSTNQKSYKIQSQFPKTPKWCLNCSFLSDVKSKNVCIYVAMIFIKYLDRQIDSARS